MTTNQVPVNTFSGFRFVVDVFVSHYLGKMITLTYIKIPFPCTDSYVLRKQPKTKIDMRRLYVLQPTKKWLLQVVFLRNNTGMSDTR